MTRSFALLPADLGRWINLGHSLNTAPLELLGDEPGELNRNDAVVLGMHDHRRNLDLARGAAELPFNKQHLRAHHTIPHPESAGQRNHGSKVGALCRGQQADESPQGFADQRDSLAVHVSLTLQIIRRCDDILEMREAWSRFPTSRR